MRLFLAIPLSSEIRSSLIGYQQRLFAAGVSGNPSAPENLHLTLTFIGEFGDPMQVLDAVSEVSFSSISLEVRGAGLFSDTLWAGLEKSSRLEKLVRDIRKALSDAEIPFDRKRFRPHITVMRRASFPAGLSGLPFPEPLSMTVDSFSLFRSDRGKNGMIYTELGRICADLPTER